MSDTAAGPPGVWDQFRSAGRWRSVADTQPATAAGPARFVLDAHDNLWRYFPDAGYVFLMVAPKTVERARQTLDALNEYVGPVREMIPGEHVGWMLSPDLAAQFDMTPLSDEYLITLEQAERDGGIKDEFADRVIPIYRKADDAD